MNIAFAAMMTLLAPTVTGNWVTQDGSAEVAIAPCGDSVCGQVVKVLMVKPGVPGTDVHNPDASLRNRAILGLQVLSGFKASDDEWTDGHIYDPKTGKTYRSKLRLNDDGSLKVYGCIAFLCETQRWLRAPS